MHRRIGANRQRKHREKARAVHGTLHKALRKAFGVSRIMILAGFVCGLGAAGAFSVVSWMNRSSLFTVASIRVEGTERLTKEEIVKLSNLHPGMRMLDIRTTSVQKSIEGNAWVKSARVSRHFPGSVVITVEERSPIALVAVGRVYYVDACGKLLPLFTGTYSNLPVITGIAASTLDSTKTLAPAVFERVKKVVSECRGEDHRLLQHISLIDFSKDPLIRMKLEDESAMVEINEADFTRKLARLEMILESAQMQPKAKPKRINLCYENLAYVEWK